MQPWRCEAAFALATAGMMVGRLVGGRLGRWAEGLGGLCLMGIGLGILIEHLAAG
ncbi:manganese efflux pump [Roseomonas mucosa]|uniref:manganese efflux pump n=1 Tax=Roseomonas sp. FDAARGOS_362 TaxID=2018065 RepID=UPI001D027767|nr:manganese efflux pump [Roseomonas sp. FDAARGOS_362]